MALPLTLTPTPTLVTLLTLYNNRPTGHRPLAAPACGQWVGWSVELYMAAEH